MDFFCGTVLCSFECKNNPLQGMTLLLLEIRVDQLHVTTLNVNGNYDVKGTVPRKNICE